jgi:hypothetical protein
MQRKNKTLALSSKSEKDAAVPAQHAHDSMGPGLPLATSLAVSFAQPAGHSE